MTNTSQKDIFVRVRDFLKPWGQAALQALLLAAVLYFIMWPVKVDGISMDATLNSGDRLLMSRAIVMAGFISRGDIVVCDADASDNDIIKRVIAVPGDKLLISNGVVTVNGVVLDESDYLGDTIVTTGDVSIILKEDEYFIMGDNREHSLDSRRTGPVKKQDIVAKAVLRFFPLDGARLF